jgi:hypothetical protein
MVGRRLVPGRARPMSKVFGVTGNVTDLTAQVVGAAVGGVFAGRGQRASVTVLECSPWLGKTTAFSGGETRWSGAAQRRWACLTWPTAQEVLRCSGDSKASSFETGGGTVRTS